mmetsp:Transcript_22142/g.36614  ORF Transcript_22142/g.36614 Transcript_22142/m.36614 type:complete len:535 (-) Transcript_22142:88-1692(-)
MKAISEPLVEAGLRLWKQHHPKHWAQREAIALFQPSEALFDCGQSTACRMPSATQRLGYQPRRVLYIPWFFTEDLTPLSPTQIQLKCYDLARFSCGTKVPSDLDDFVRIDLAIASSACSLGVQLLGDENATAIDGVVPWIDRQEGYAFAPQAMYRELSKRPDRPEKVALAHGRVPALRISAWVLKSKYGQRKTLHQASQCATPAGQAKCPGCCVRFGRVQSARDGSFSSRAFGELVQHVGLPAVLKPAEGSGASASSTCLHPTLVKTHEEARRIALAWLAKRKWACAMRSGGLLLEQAIPGAEIYAEVVMAQGVPASIALRASVVQQGYWYTQHSPPLITPRAASACRTDVTYMAVGLGLNAGVFGIQLRMDAQARTCMFMELNPRPSMWPLLFDLRFQKFFQDTVWDYGTMAILTALGEKRERLLSVHTDTASTAPLRLSVMCNLNRTRGQQTDTLDDIARFERSAACHARVTPANINRSMLSFAQIGVRVPLPMNSNTHDLLIPYTARLPWSARSAHRAYSLASTNRVQYPR